MNDVIVLLFFLTIFLVNIYIFINYKKDILFKQKQLSEEKVKKYLLYISSIIENKNKEIDELSVLYETDDDKELKAAIMKKKQEKDALQEELTRVVGGNNENKAALKIENNILHQENEKLNLILKDLSMMTENAKDSPKSKEMQEKYKKLSLKYNNILEEYKDAKKKLEELDEEFTTMYD